MFLAWQTSRRRATGLAVAVSLAIALAGGGCHRSPARDPGAGGIASPRAGAQPHHTPQQVCTGFAHTRFGHDTTRDPGPQAAHERARSWMRPDHTRATLPAGRDPRWDTWRPHRVAVAVTKRPWARDGLPPDSEHTAHRAVVVATTPVGADGWTGPTETHTVLCTLTVQDGTWYVATYHVDSGGGSP